MKKFLMAAIAVIMLAGCGSTVQPTVGSGEVSDETLSKNTVSVGLLTFQEVSNYYGNNQDSRKDN